MKFDRNVKKQRMPKGFRNYIEGPGRVDDSKPINLAEEVAPDTRSHIEKAKKRIVELDTLIMKVYEDHVLGSLSEERYNNLSFYGYSPANAGQDIIEDYNDYIYKNDYQLKDSTVVTGIYDVGYKK